MLVKVSVASLRDFYVSEKVTKVTKTQFTTSSGKRFKKSGKQIGVKFCIAFKKY